MNFQLELVLLEFQAKATLCFSISGRNSRKWWCIKSVRYLFMKFMEKIKNDINPSFFYIRRQKELGFPVKLILWVGRFLINGNSVDFCCV